mmetsp:Transcript_134881/g.431052  ORF Transcript_134881/g.431052 Transcript_134881/m.431052 type:complete len:201 (+) Transcript_134881:143-745(+)
MRPCDLIKYMCWCCQTDCNDNANTRRPRHWTNAVIASWKGCATGCFVRRSVSAVALRPEPRQQAVMLVYLPADAQARCVPQRIRSHGAGYLKRPLALDGRQTSTRLVPREERHNEHGAPSVGMTLSSMARLQTYANLGLDLSSPGLSSQAHLLAYLEVVPSASRHASPVGGRIMQGGRCARTCVHDRRGRPPATASSPRR